jgi:gliding motility-associated-like protein
MKTKIYLFALLGFAIRGIMSAQSPSSATSHDSIPFNLSFWTSYAEKLQLNPAEKLEFISSHKRAHSAGSNHSPAGNKPFNLQNILTAGPCTNIDFESGMLNGWTTSSGFHPLFNPSGCCPNPGGQQLVTSGPGLDPAGNFPIVAPGGNFSLRLGDNNVGGQADRIEQTFLVSPNNANFTYRYAVVFQDPGHITSQQPAFTVEMLDSANNQVPCTYYNVAAGQNIPGFLNSQNFAGVVYKPWSNVLVDLTNYIGQNITIRFTTYDCALGGHYGYAYIDGICQSFVSGSSDSVCVGGSTSFCAPSGLASYTWTGPGVNNVIGQCVTASAAGIYSCQTKLFTGCQGPTFTYTLVNFPYPNVSFSPSSPNACSPQFTFNNTSTIPSGFIASYSWQFGNYGTSMTQSPQFNFPGQGTYQVTLTAISNHGCYTSAVQQVEVHPAPVASFTFNNACQNAAVIFTNTSQNQQGNITAYSWNFSNGNTSLLQNPSETFNASGNYNVSMSVTNSNSCTSTATAAVSIYPLPNVFFTNNTSCLGSSASFTNNSTIVSGVITNFVWDFDNNGQPDSFNQNPSYTYPSAGNYTTVLSAVSNFGCVNSGTALVMVYANPTASFSAQNACLGNNVTFSNSSAPAPGGQIINYSWNLGNGNYSGSANPQFNYNAAGTYTVILTALSNNGCTSTYSSTASVYYLPVVNFNCNYACHNQTTQFNNSTIINGGTIARWRWDFENNGSWDDTLNVNPAKVYPSPGQFTAKLQAVSNNGCVSEKTNLVIVHGNPVADFINTPACFGDASTFSNTSHSADGAITSYQWDFNGDNVIDNVSANPSYTYGAYGTYLLKLEVQTQYGCSNVKSKSMYVNPRPKAMFVASDTASCPPFCITFTNQSTIGTGKIANVYWNFGDGSNTIADKGNPTRCFNSGKYNVWLMAVSDSGCRSTLVKPSYITVYPKPTAGFKVEPEEVDENAPDIQVTSTASGADYTTYYLNDQGVYQYPNFSHTLKNIDKITPVIYQVVKNKYGCSDTSEKVVKIKPAFVIYFPNTFTPNDDGVNDGWFAKGIGVTKFNVQVFDRWGHVLFSTNNMDEAWDGRSHGSTGPIKQDVYVWKAEVRDVFNKNHELTGTVTLLKSED